MASSPVPVTRYARQTILKQLTDWTDRLKAAADPIEAEMCRKEIDSWLDELSQWHAK